jgi:hypothetical protein
MSYEVWRYVPVRFALLNDSCRSCCVWLLACTACTEPAAITAESYLMLPVTLVECVWNVMAHAQKPNLFFRRNGRVHLNRRGRQFSRLLTAEVCASAAVMLDTPCSEEVWRVLATHSIRQFPLHFPSRASPCAITFQLDSNYVRMFVLYTHVVFVGISYDS